MYTVCGLLHTNIDISSQSESENAEDEIREAFQVFDGVRFFYKFYKSIFISLLINQIPSSSHCYCSIKSQANFFIVHAQDGNGFINRQELAVVMGNLGESLTQEEIQVYLGTSLKLSTPTFQQHRQPENLIILGEGLIKEEIQVYL